MPPSGRFPLVRDLVVRRVDTGAATNVALPCGRSPECWPGSPSWAPDGGRLASRCARQGSHARAVYSVGADGSGLTKLLEFGGTLEDLRRGPGGELAMLATESPRKEVGATEAGAPITGDLDEPPAEQRIAVLEAGALRFVSPPDLFVYEYDWLPDGTAFVGTAAPGNGDDNWWIAKLYVFSADGCAAAAALCSEEHPPATGRARDFARRSKTVAFIAGLMSDFGLTGGDVYTVPFAGGAATNLTQRMHATATALGWGCDGKLRAALLAGDQTEVVELGPGAAPAAPVERSRIARRHELRPVCPTGPLRYPRDICGAARRSRSARSATGATHPRQRRADDAAAGAQPVLEERRLRRTGLAAPAPRATGHGKLPMVTIVHGGPAAAVTPRFIGPGLGVSLLERGYALFRPNPRGSFGQGERVCGGQYPRLRPRRPARHPARASTPPRQAAPIDEARLGITGHSYGGYMTMWAVDPDAPLQSRGRRRRHQQLASRTMARTASTAGCCPTLALRCMTIRRSMRDRRRSPSSATSARRPMKTSASRIWSARRPRRRSSGMRSRRCGVPTASVIYPGEGHQMRDPDHIADVARRTVEWFDKYLGPGVPVRK